MIIIFDSKVCHIINLIEKCTLLNKYVAKLNKIENDKKVFADYNIESCMMNKVMTEDPSLDDTNFKSYFENYFNNLNSNIDEKYLYITN